MRTIFYINLSVILLIVPQIFAVSSKESDTLFISAEDLLNANFYITYPRQESQEEFLWRFSPGDDSLWADPNYDDSN